MTVDEHDDGGRLDGGRRRVVLALGLAGGAVVAGAVLGLALAGGSSGPSRAAEIAKLPPLGSGSVVAAPRASPERLDSPVGMGSLHAGVALTALERVEEVRTTDGRRRAPEGSTLVAFELADWTCEDRPCDPWRSLGPHVVIDGDTTDIPPSGDTFVVVVPPGADDVDVLVDADGQHQSISLLDADTGPDNIVLLDERGTERRVTIGESFAVGERTSIALDDGAGGQATTFQREARVEYAQRRYFLDGAVPSSPSKAFLVVNAYYSYAGRAGQYVFVAGEARFVDGAGHAYEARDLDPSPDHGLLGFEVPASVGSGTLVIGGATQKTSSTGVGYVSQLEEHRVAIDVG